MPAPISTDPTGTERLEKDDAFHLLQNSRRRATLRYLFEYELGEGHSMREVAEEVAAWENDTTVAQLHSNERQRVYIALYQSHLPKLADAGVIDYDQDRGLVALRPLAQVLEPYLADGLRSPDALELEAPGEGPATEDSGSLGLSSVTALLGR